MTRIDTDTDTVPGLGTRAHPYLTATMVKPTNHCTRQVSPLGASAPCSRTVIALVFVLLLASPSYLTAQPAYAAAYNCVNVLLRDPFWGQYRGTIQTGWNAAGVGTAFARQGWTVDSTPSVGAIVVWPPNYFGASAAGHVGLVADVYDNGTILVRHENWPYGTPEHAQVFPQRPGFQYVHRPDAVSVVDAPAAPAAPAGDTAA